MCYQEDTEERTKFKELYPDKETEDEEAVFKKPKPKVSCSKFQKF